MKGGRRALADGLPLDRATYCCTIALPARVIWVCASSLPLSDAPVLTVIWVLESTTPSMCAVVPRLTMPATCQTMFLACAPPVGITRVADAWVTPPAIWKIQVSFAPPLSVTLLGMRTVLDHLYRPAGSVRPPMLRDALGNENCVGPLVQAGGERE